MQRKFLERPFQLKGIKENGVFSGYGSVFDVVDSYNEVVAKGAFTRSLEAMKQKQRMPALLWQHNSNEPVGVYAEMHEDETGLFVQGQLAMKTARGAEAYELLRMGAISGLSIGYNVVKEEQDKGTGITVLKEIDLWEVSLVTFPANDAARVQTVKTILESGELPTIREMERFLREAGFSQSQAKAFLAHGYNALSLREADETAFRQGIEHMIDILN
ncbi:HK97 family phage prohead protease [bacterium]|nr:HK97 family phage prohead protease [bacterium]